MSGPARIARIRRAALGLIPNEWCCFVDDDNVVEPGHCASLLACATDSSAPAAHSWRTLWTTDGKPLALEGRHPWCRDAVTAEQLFDQYEAAGIYQRDSSTVRDQVVPYRRELSMVDTSEWIFRTGFLADLDFCTEYSFEDWVLGRTEDNKLLDQIVSLGISVPCTRLATLQYWLGGYSNNPAEEAASLDGWLC